jgi:RecB family exonuclease
VSDKPHLSATQLDSFCRCPEAYRRRYIEGERIPPSIAMLKGTGFHRGAETNFRQKIESHVDLKAKDIVDAAVSAFDAEVEKGIELQGDDKHRGKTVVVAETKDSLVSVVQVHARDQAPQYQPVFVEESFTLTLPGTRDLKGVIDLADNLRRVTDLKSAGKSKSQADADNSVQLTVYAAGHHALTGHPPSEVRLDTIVTTKTKTYRNVVSSDRGVDDFTALAHRIDAVSTGIDLGNFPPATPGAWWCGPKFCGFYASCKFVNSHRNGTGEE